MLISGSGEIVPAPDSAYAPFTAKDAAAKARALPAPDAKEIVAQATKKTA